MKKFFVPFLALAALLTACDDAPKGDNATVSDKKEAAAGTGTSFMIDTTESRVHFTGRGAGHNQEGDFKLAEGSVAVANNAITGGKFVINIKSLSTADTSGPGKLRGHLMSGDFFNADSFGTATFEITAVAPYSKTDKDSSLVEGANFSISGNLTLKGRTKNITFPAHVEMDGNTLKAKANFDIDRTQWEMHYGSKRTAKDNIISDEVNIKLDLEAKSVQAPSAYQTIQSRLIARKTPGC